jgi:WD40 repeat protein
VRVDPSGRKKFATGSHDRTIKIWDINQLKCIATSEADRYDASFIFIAKASGVLSTLQTARSYYQPLLQECAKYGIQNQGKLF